ncbi:Abhydrolase_6 domain-containing protein [Cephalotus follicularis]|uniref:Abhydrolase_6 domain-containing protein n=1 Tax=Cephalotus follicularis TaxID=3775 RepID=A0A1Q3CP76_CEPFO|nr:Abhydrolase_6 domain-containing protein [Cephalotus follicularis]
MVVQAKPLSASMNARIIGSGVEPIILAHGYGGNQSLWDRIIPSLTNHYRVVVFDWNFSGAVKDPNLFDPVKYASYDAFADDLITLMNEMNLKSSVFIGHSMSGMIGCIASIKRPELFKKLIFIGASPRYINLDDYEGGLDTIDVEGIISTIESDFHKWASNFAPLAIGANDPPSVNQFESSLKSMRPEVALSLAKTVFYSDYRDILEKVLTSCTIIQTANDMVAPISVAYYMQKKIKGKSTVEIIDTDGHFPQLTAHLQLIDVLGRYA